MANAARIAQEKAARAKVAFRQAAEEAQMRAMGAKALAGLSVVQARHWAEERSGEAMGWAGQKADRAKGLISEGAEKLKDLTAGAADKIKDWAETDKTKIG